MNDLRHCTVDLEDGHLGLRLHGPGDGPLVLALPGLGRSGADFDRLAAVLAAGGCRLAALDPRGVGRSSGVIEGATLEDHARDALRVLERLAGGPATVIGHTFGGRVARLLAHLWPRAVDHLVLLAAGGLVPPDAETVSLARRFMSLVMARDASPDSETEALGLARRLYFAPGSVVPGDWLDGFSAAALAAQRSASHATPAGPWLHGGKAPTTVIQGLADRIAPPANGRRLAALDAGTTLHELADAGHFLLLERPRTIAGIILSTRRGSAAGRG